MSPCIICLQFMNVTNVIPNDSSIPPKANGWVLRGSAIKSALLANLQLETLHLTCNEKEPIDEDWNVVDMRKFPHVKELVIRGLLGVSLFRICDWLNITHLKLTNISNLTIVEILLPEELSRLKILIIAYGC